MTKKKFLFRSALTAVMLALSVICSPENVQAQGSSLYTGGWRVNLDTTGRKYFRLIVWNQVWARYQEFNPGSAVNSEPAKDYSDIMLRRSRFLIYGQISPDNLLMFHFGINNQTFTSGGDGT
ncbi:MAG: porin, partial [Rhizobacter sp.]|nr:porin [Chlorobiales bacterium]